jgi:hypothetical protein
MEIMDFSPKPIGEKPANAVGFTITAAAQYLLFGGGEAGAGEGFTSWLELHLQHTESGTDSLIATSTVTSYGRQTAYAGTSLFLQPGNYALYALWQGSGGDPKEPKTTVEEPRIVAPNQPFERKNSNKGGRIQSVFRFGFERPIYVKAVNRVRAVSAGGFVDVVLKATNLKTGATVNETKPNPNYYVGNGVEAEARFSPIVLPVGQDILLEAIPSNLSAAPDYFHEYISTGQIP